MSDNAWDQLESSAERRRQTRKQFERGMLGESSGFKFNDLMLAFLVVIAAVISYTDFSFSFGYFRNITILSAFLYILTMLVYQNRYERGKRRGKEDEDYRQALKEYRDKRREIYANNLAAKVPIFCIEYKKRELKEYRESLLCDIDMDYEEYRTLYLRKSDKEIMQLKISLDAKRTLIRCNRAKSINLVPGRILNENGEVDRHKLIGQSGRERERHDKRKDAIGRAVFVLFGAVVAVDVIFHFELSTIIEWVARMLPVVVAIITGGDSGYCNITVTETAFKRDQVGVMELFEEWAQSSEPQTVSDRMCDQEKSTDTATSMAAE